MKLYVSVRTLWADRRSEGFTDRAPVLLPKPLLNASDMVVVLACHLGHFHTRKILLLEILHQKETTIRRHLCWICMSLRYAVPRGQVFWVSVTSYTAGHPRGSWFSVWFQYFTPNFCNAVLDNFFYFMPKKRLFFKVIHFLSPARGTTNRKLPVGNHYSIHWYFLTDNYPVLKCVSQ